MPPEYTGLSLHQSVRRLSDTKPHEWPFHLPKVQQFVHAGLPFILFALTVIYFAMNISSAGFALKLQKVEFIQGSMLRCACYYVVKV
jgi:hypothetical protein